MGRGRWATPFTGLHPRLFATEGVRFSSHPSSHLHSLPSPWPWRPSLKACPGQYDRGNHVTVRWPARLQAHRQSSVRLVSEKLRAGEGKHCPRLCISPPPCLCRPRSGVPALCGFAGSTHQGSVGAGGSQMVFFARGKETVSYNCRHKAS